MYFTSGLQRFSSIPLSLSQSPKSGSSYSDLSNWEVKMRYIKGRNPLKAGQVIPTIICPISPPCFYFGRNPLKAGQVIPTKDGRLFAAVKEKCRNPLKAGQVIPTPYCQRASVSMLIILFPSPLCRRSDLPQAWRERARVRGQFFFSPSPLSSPIKGEEIIKKNFTI